MKIGIIGTAGRKEDAAKLTAKHVEYMIQIALMHVSSKDTVVSGGAAWGDHSTVIAGYMKQRLFLHLPCKWDPIKKQYFDNGSSDWRTNPGSTSNFYHKKFSKVYGYNSLEELHKCWLESQKRDVPPSERKVIWCDSYKGFHDRDISVGKVDKIIAFTFSKGSVPKDGGTLYTWQHSTAPIKLHFDLGNV